MTNNTMITRVSGRDAEGKIYAFKVLVEHTPESVKELIKQIQDLVPTAKSVAMLIETVETESKV